MTKLRKALPFVLFLLAPACAFSQNECSFTYPFTGNSTQIGVSNLSGQTPCVNWRLTLSVSGTLSSTVTFQTSPDNVTFISVGSTSCSTPTASPCIIEGANPIVGTQGMMYVKSYGAFVRVVVTSSSGSGTGTVRAYGAKGATANAGSGGSGGGGASPGGNNTAAQFNNAGTFGGDETKFQMVQAAVSDPTTAPIITNVGTPGSSTYGYAYTWQTGVGGSLPSSTGLTTTGNATLDATNYNVVAPPACPTGVGIFSVGIFRSNTKGSTARYSQGWLGNIACGGSFHDTGDVCDLNGSFGCALPTTNKTSGEFVAPGFTVAGKSAFGNTAVNQSNDYYLDYSDVGMVYYDEPPNPDTTSGGFLVNRHVPNGTGGQLVALGTEIISTRDNASNIGFMNGTMQFTGHFGSGNINILRGIDNNVEHQSSGHVGTMVGTLTLAQANGTGNTDALVGVSSSVLNGSTGVVTNAYAFYADFIPKLGTNITNAYGLYLNSITGGSAGNVAIKTHLGRNEFGDVVNNASVVFSVMATRMTTDGDQIYCTDCKVTSAIDNTCVNGGAGAMAFRVAGTNKCLQ
jgi:hypothetical protein